MLRKIVPLIMLLLGSTAGVAAGLYLRPQVDSLENSNLVDAESGENSEPIDILDNLDRTAPKPEDNTQYEYVKMTNQFVIPVIEDGEVASLVLMSLSVEIEPGYEDDVLLKEPKLRDTFLQVLFDYANTGGFAGAFTNVRSLNALRNNLKHAAISDMGKYVTDVLITDLARQDY